jgi:hypothetical protein
MLADSFASMQEASVKRATELWLKTVTSGTATAAQDTAALYAPDAILWGTLSEEVSTVLFIIAQALQ